MIVVDGRTDEEKLLELLGVGAEETALDFKSTLDLSGKASRDSLEFAKDAISMGNLPEGGYIVVGVDDRGAPAHSQPGIVLAQFDSAKLRAKVARFVEAPVNIVSQPHVVDERDVVLIHVVPNPEGLPVPTSCIGQYAKADGKMETVFAEGEVLMREGSSNVRLRYAHWPGLLEQYRERIKQEARRDADELVRRVVEGLRSSGGNAPSVPIDPGMDDVTLSEALIIAFDTGATVRVQQFLNSAAVRAGSGTADARDDRLRALDQIAVVACQAVLYRQDDVFRSALTALERSYKARGLASDYNVRLHGNDVERAGHYLDVLIRVLAIGALSVRREAWDLLGDLANRPVNSSGYDWPSWLRHAITMASRANLLQESDGGTKGGEVLSLARALVAGSSALRPDYGPDVLLPDPSDLAADDWLFNSLCEFDLWWCLLARSTTPDAREASSYYPSCAAFHQWRSQPTLHHIATEPSTRHSAFGAIPDSEIANAMLVVVNMAVGQSHQYGGWWDGLQAEVEVAKYVQEHATQGL